ncbi:MAG TPA: hypothetical protein P5084_14950 [Paludibacter sp.]|nr:hypothetical protein [Paludibacter sp.]
MITQKRNIFKNTLRFRRWSRANYAVFLSLGVCVTIGFLSNSIAEKSVSKTSEFKAKCTEFHSTTGSDQNDLLLENTLFTKQLQEILSTETSSEYTAAHTYKYFT